MNVEVTVNGRDIVIESKDVPLAVEALSNDEQISDFPIMIGGFQSSPHVKSKLKEFYPIVLPNELSKSFETILAEEITYDQVFYMRAPIIARIVQQAICKYNIYYTDIGGALMNVILSYCPKIHLYENISNAHLKRSSENLCLSVLLILLLENRRSPDQFPKTHDTNSLAADMSLEEIMREVICFGVANMFNQKPTAIPYYKAISFFQGFGFRFDFVLNALFTICHHQQILFGANHDVSRCFEVGCNLARSLMVEKEESNNPNEDGIQYHIENHIENTEELRCIASSDGDKRYFKPDDELIRKIEFLKEASGIN